MILTCFHNQPRISQSLNSNHMTNLPVVDNLLKENQHFLRQEPLKNTVIVYVHHALQTSINVINSLLMLGAKPAYIYILGKSYSENKAVVKHLKALGITYIDSSDQIGFGEYKRAFQSDINHLWTLVEKHMDDGIKDILVLDHGGHAIQSIPQTIKSSYRIIGIEKTTAGTMGYTLENKPDIPIINVAGCAAKRLLESPLIADAVSFKVGSIIKTISKEKICAVVGYGAIGKSVASVLKNQGKQVLVYDKNYLISDNVSLEDIIEKSDYIFGCTGTDITLNIVHSIVETQGSKVFLSCSSEDKEFLSLLKEVTKDRDFSQDQLFSDVIFNTKNDGKIVLVNGGFPVNFDDSGESVPARDIQLTRALVIGGVIDAIKMRQGYNDFQNDLFKLSADIQKTIVSSWSNERLSENEIPGLFKSVKLIEKESLGVMPMVSGIKAVPMGRIDARCSKKV
ncbi:NAD(P)-dependent oxidoreductase [Legionella yabuuchiae]|uniref:NAD(P)-dependent oxidoreductase n=1 Tax=Legionella yabuuchiae TaxID=376727 RepID=UPI0013EF9490|nr:NAD(P)-dependent oxidoreductase [Legionella yabuuchiae]